MPPALWMILFVTFVSCAQPGGPIVTGCVVSGKNPALLGFQCVTEGGPSFFKPLAQGYDLKCASPHDFEDALKACRNHQVLTITLCSLEAVGDFLCIDPQLNQFHLSLSDADNYFCLSEEDRQRVIQRCGVY